MKEEEEVHRKKGHLKKGACTHTRAKERER
jgi:hypothetical protein